MKRAHSGHESTGQPTLAATFPTSPGTCSESVRLTLALYSMSVVLTKLMSFSPEAPRPTAADADQGASVKKKKRPYSIGQPSPLNRPPAQVIAMLCSSRLKTSLTTMTGTKLNSFSS